MATGMSLWRIDEAGAAQIVSEATLSREEVIEAAIESSPNLLGDDLLVVGRQTQTPSGPLDLLAIDSDGRLVIIENKRDRTPREVLAQTIDYAAWVNALTFSEVATIYAAYRLRFGHDSADLAEDFEERFGEPLESLADAPRMIVVAARLDDSTERMIEFLSDSFGVPVNAVLFQPFEGGLVGRTWLRPDTAQRSSSGRRSTANSAGREQSRLFWDAWLPIGRDAFPEIRLPTNGPRAVLIKRRIIPGVPAAMVFWVSASESYAEVQFDDPEPAVNSAFLAELTRKRDVIEAEYGGALEWRDLDASELMTRRTKIVTEKVDIGSRAEPSVEGMHCLVDVGRRLLDAVKPHLAAAFEDVAAAGAPEDDDTADVSASSSL